VLPATSVKYRIRGSGRSDEKPRRGGAARASKESPPRHGSDLHRHRSRCRGIPHRCTRWPASGRDDALSRAGRIRGGAGVRGCEEAVLFPRWTTK